MKATAETWATLHWFRADEPAFGHPERNAWGDPGQMEVELLVKLEAFRQYLGRPVYIHEGYNLAGHATRSAHHDGQAVDCHVAGMSLINQWIAAERFDFRGIGIYPHWANPGLHLDVRPLGPNQPGARWWRDAAGIYQVLDADAVDEILTVTARTT